MRINVRYIWTLLILFFFLYNPPILSNNLLLHLLCVISILLLIKSNKNAAHFINMFANTRIWIFSIILLFISFYLIIYDSVSASAEVAYGRIYLYITIAIELVLISYYFALNYWKKNKILEDFLKDILIVGNIQGGIGFIAFLNSTIKDFLVNWMYANGVDKIDNYLLSVRFYGFASYLTSTTAIIQSILAIVALWMTLQYSVKYFIFFPLLVFSAVFNARASLIIMAWGIVLISIYNVNIRSKKMWKDIILLALLICMFIKMILPQLRSFESWEWIQSGLDEIFAFLEGNEIGYFEYLKDGLIFPEKMWQIVCGTGHAIFRGDISSDIGYVNDIWMIGIILTGCMYIAFICAILYNYKNNIKSIKFLQVFLVGVFVIYNIKGIVISNNEIIRFCILLIVMIYFLPQKVCKVEGTI